VADHAQVVGDEQIGQTQLVLQVLQQVDDPGLDGDIQGRDRLVADDKLWIGGQSAGDADALPLPAGELVEKEIEEWTKFCLPPEGAEFRLSRAQGPIPGKLQVQLLATRPPSAVHLVEATPRRNDVALVQRDGDRLSAG